MSANEWMKPLGDPYEKYYNFWSGRQSANVILLSEKQHQLFTFTHTCWIKNEVLHLREQWCTISPENVILFIMVTQRLLPFVGDHPKSISTSSIGHVASFSAFLILVG